MALLVLGHFAVPVHLANVRVRFVSYRSKPPIGLFSAQYDCLLQPHTIFSGSSSSRNWTPGGPARHGGVPLLDALGYGCGTATAQPSFRCISTSSWLRDQPSSKVEVTVQTLKKKEKEQQQQQQQQLANGGQLSGAPNGTTAPVAATAQVLGDSGVTVGTAPNVSATASSSGTVSTEQQTQATPAAAVVTTAPVVKKTLKQRIWAELVHYYHGFRLLFIDINISRKLLWRVLNGKTLTRREHKLLIRTTSDLFRLVPFSVFIIVPFMELLLPLAIKLFPGMLPSTFQTATEREDKIKQNLKVKIEMAKFLQKTLDDMAVQNKDHRSQAAKDFSEFFTRIRTTENFTISNEEILKFSKLFEDEITLDSLTRQQLQALCRVLEVSPIGTSNLLRFQLRLKLRNLAADDRTIQKEGIESLNLSELQAACRARGMRAYGASEERLKSQLQEWINLSLNEKVPPSLLLLSRALVLPENITTSDKLKATISSLPDSVATVTKAAIGEREGKIDNKTKIEVIKEEERKIKEEREEEKEKQKEQQELVDGAPVLTADGKTVDPGTAAPEQPEIIFAPAPANTIVLDQIPPQPHTVEEISSKDLEVLGDALGTLSKDKKSLLVEKEEIRDLKEEIADYQEDVQELQEVVTAARNQEEVQVKESRAAKLLFRKVNSMINRMDTVLTELERKEKQLKEKMHAAVQSEEAQKPQAADEELVRIDELMSAIKKIQNVTDDSRLDQISKILGKIDDDQDGQIKVEDVLKVIETIGKENVKLNAKQVDELIDLLDKEEELEAEDKIEKALTKSLEAKEKQKEQKEKEKEKLLELTDKATDLSSLAPPPSLSGPTKQQQLDDGTAIIDADALQKVVEERKKNASINGASSAGTAGTASAAKVVPPPTATKRTARLHYCQPSPLDDVLGCRLESGELVDWYYLYKLPKESSERDSPTNGLRYTFVSSKDAAEPSLQWHTAQYNVNQSTSATGRTITASTRHPSTILTIMYNDEPTNAPVDMERGHTKGVVSTDGTTGYWLIHSVPKFPPTVGTEYSYPHTGMLYGQSFLCISLNATEMERVGQQLLYNEVTVYSSSVPPALAGRFPTLKRVAQMAPVDMSPPFYSQQTIRSRAGVEFVTFAKSRHFGKELYADWIAPALDVGLMVESWQHGSGNLPSECNRRHSVLNVREVSVGRTDRFTTLKDHSKWAVGDGGTGGTAEEWICVGDINRQEHQKQRGGGSVCQASRQVAGLYRGMIDEVEPCPK
uniref:Mitochondrial proton/calcium exchanger protein n=1 Tax=Anopheles epiroticus TaxID=199890 RepID=A0A182P5R4_9DIPT